MDVGLLMNYSGGFAEAARGLSDFEAAGVDAVLLPEAYTFDSVSQLGYLAARTGRMRLASGILNVYSRTPALLAMTAAGLDFVSDGRFELGIGASGPQVVEGFHGLPYTAPLARVREVVEICRTVWRREPLRHEGRHFQLPLTAERGGSGRGGRALRLINHPVRPAIPIVLAALGAKSVELAAELCDGWQPTLYLPEAAKETFGPSLEAGRSRRADDLAPLRVLADVKMLVSEDEEELEAARWQVREYIALYVGGMGARGGNFYKALVSRYGFEGPAAEIEELYQSGRKAEAAAAVPAELLDGVALVGPPALVAERVAAFRESGVTGLNASPVALTHDRRVEDMRELKRLAG
ncbi:LLM class F420-dependent oxidoreductase [Streptomyces sp. NBC_01239]|uniref:LLM class F420-dependent oxidoreductase n=1 Tax=Streptomyces sp. NBC_01239 TaxID=2903792 RepID=UPI00225461DC|nr:LLM class F420-dependent oxidoreductase [Streptomyces sp. NBC_01239]MCX4815194.1 LLM class F420-dependent oxidoreductase [Streptomyces sp. NBC_01239]